MWGPNWVGDTHVVDVHLSNLRRKLDHAASELRVIHTVRGVGFRISNEVLDAAEQQATTGLPVAERSQNGDSGAGTDAGDDSDADTDTDLDTEIDTDLDTDADVAV